MKFELKTFQIEGVSDLLNRMTVACTTYYNANQPTSCGLSAVTGSGKTVMAASAIEAIFNGSQEFGIQRDPKACVLWVTDSPALNKQTIDKFIAATDLDPSLIETIENTFTDNHFRLEPGHVYFLNRQKLAKTGMLVKGGEHLTFWQILQNTYQSITHVYMVLDEAHRGLGSAAVTEKDKATIYSQLIDGFGTLGPMPVVVGLSATIKRFQDAMSGKRERVAFPMTSIKPRDVQESGLLKDTILIRVPTAKDPVSSIYLNDACTALNNSRQAWAGWNAQNPDAPEVVPLLVVQVPDNVSDRVISAICSEIVSKLEFVNPSESFANVFGEHTNLHIGSFDIPYVAPETVQANTNIIVLFAKEAISTGWDCPRAEVIYSMRPHSDYTYISQLIGRMVRTPLARRVDIDTLNSVSCFLPFFDPQTVQKVVDRLTKDVGEEDGSGSGNSGRKVILRPVTVQWDTDLGVDEAFEAIMSRKRSAEKRKYIKGLLDYTGLLLKYEVDLDAEDYAMTKLLRELNDSILTFNDEFESAKTALSRIESTDVTFKMFDEQSIATNTRTDTADAYAIKHAREKADSSFELALTNKYFAQEHSRGISNRDANIAVAAAASVPAIVLAVTEKAKAILDDLQRKYDLVIAGLGEAARADFSAKMYINGIQRIVKLVKPIEDIYDGDQASYPKHVMNNPETHLAPISLDDMEKAVVSHELRRGAIAWYRNPSTGNDHALSIMYQDTAKGGKRAMHPDFIFFEKVGSEVKPYLIDPHGTHLADAVDKLKGFSEYAEEFGEQFTRIWALAEVNGEKHYLDLKDVVTRGVIKDYTGSTVEPLYQGEYAHLYS